MTNAIIIHGTGGSPDGNWFPWMKGKLESIGMKTYVPRFPLEEQQNLTNWMNEFDKYRQFLSQDTIMIGHSLGPGFIFNVLEKIDFKIRAAFLVSPFIGLLNNGSPSNAYFNNLNKTFVDKDFNFKKIKDNCQKFYIYYGDDDPYVPCEKPEYLIKELRADYRIIKNGGHLNAEFGYTEFEMLFEDIKKEVSI